MHTCTCACLQHTCYIYAHTGQDIYRLHVDDVVKMWRIVCVAESPIPVVCPEAVLRVWCCVSTVINNFLVAAVP